MKSSPEAAAVAGGSLAVSRAVWIAMAVYAVVLAALGIDRYVTYHAGMDLGLFAQSVADATHGFHNTPEGGSHYVRHFSPILWLAVPVLAIVRSPVALTVVQAIAGALVAPAVYLIARRRTDETMANLVAIVSLLYPPLVGVTFTDFHENGFAPAVIAWLLWAVDSRRFGWATLFAVLALCIKEDEALFLAVLGAGYAVYSLRRSDRNAAAFAAAVSALGCAVFIAYFTVVRVWAGAVGPWTPITYYGQGSASDVLGVAGVWHRLSFMLEAFVPLLFIPLRSPVVLLAIPGFIEAVASRWSITYTMGQHYPGAWIGYVLVAFSLACAAMWATNAQRTRRLAWGCVAVCSLILVFASPTHWAHFLGLPTAHTRALDRTVAIIPSNARVCAVDEVYVHLSLDPAAQVGYAGPCEYMIVDQHYDSPTWQNTYSSQVTGHLHSGAYALIRNDDGVQLYRLRGRA
ncbi:MAG: DUF2079 domain-containing protein [Candidatus Eremiobacteraeota bacterium]|nr:DUF2079 domain-containing protein [Candidatus Eremiobacteraeota bacterium]